jgi:hypothetical protein
MVSVSRADHRPLSCQYPQMLSEDESRRSFCNAGVSSWPIGEDSCQRQTSQVTEVQPPRRSRSSMALFDPLRSSAVHRSMHEIGLIAWRARRSLRAYRDRATLLRLDARELDHLGPLRGAMSASRRAIPRVNHSDTWQRQLSRMASSHTVVLGLEVSCRRVC